MNWLKSLFSPRTPLELATLELLDAQRSKLASDSAAEYAEAMSLYHQSRIERLSDVINQATKEQA